MKFIYPSCTLIIPDEKMRPMGYPPIILFSLLVFSGTCFSIISTTLEVILWWEGEERGFPYFWLLLDIPICFMSIPIGEYLYFLKIQGKEDPLSKILEGFNNVIGMAELVLVIIGYFFNGSDTYNWIIKWTILVPFFEILGMFLLALILMGLGIDYELSKE